RLDIPSAKLTVVFPEGKLPAIDPAEPAFILVLGSYEIWGKLNPKAARKLGQHKRGSVLQGKLIVTLASCLWPTRAFPGSNPRPKRRRKGVGHEHDHETD